MDGKIYDLLKKIDEVGIAKFGLEKEQRIFLKRLLMDENFLNQIIEKNKGIENFLNNLNEIYMNLLDIGNDINKIKQISNNNEELKKITEEYFGKELEELEKKRDGAIFRLVSENVREENLKKDEENKIQLILDKLKNNN